MITKINASAAAAAAAAEAATIAATLASQTASKAAELATVASNTAAALAIKTAEATAIISNDITWMKKSLTGIESSLKDMSGIFVTNEQFMEHGEKVKDHELRVRKIEEQTRLWVGGLAVLAIAMPFIMKVFFKF